LVNRRFDGPDATRSDSTKSGSFPFVGIERPLINVGEASREFSFPPTGSSSAYQPQSLLPIWKAAVIPPVGLRAIQWTAAVELLNYP
jgi:hypothetical protein